MSLRSRSKYPLFAVLAVSILGLGVVAAAVLWTGSVTHQIEVTGLKGLLFNPTDYSSYHDKTTQGSLVTYSGLPSIGVVDIDHYQASASYIVVSCANLPTGVTGSIEVRYGAWRSVSSVPTLFTWHLADIDFDDVQAIVGSKILWVDTPQLWVGEPSVQEGENCLILLFDFDTSACEDFGQHTLDIDVTLGNGA